MRVVFMGTPAFAVPSLHALLESEHSVVGVVTQPDRPKGRGHEVVYSPVKVLAQEHQLPILQPDKMKSPDFLERLAAWQPDVIAVTAFGRILPKSILELPPQGCVNVHGSLLPRYRGAAPIQWALINGDSETGITTMLMDEGMDTGPILLQRTVPIEPEDTAAELAQRLAQVGGDLLVETLQLVDTQTAVPHIQDEAFATLAPLLKKEDGNIDWTLPAPTIVNRIRGLSPWPGSYTFLGADRLMIWKGAVEDQPTGSLDGSHEPGTMVRVGKKEVWVLTGNGVLKVTEVQAPNKKRMAVESFLQGQALRPGMVLKAEPTATHVS